MISLGKLQAFYCQIWAVVEAILETPLSIFYRGKNHSTNFSELESSNESSLADHLCHGMFYDMSIGAKRCYFSEFPHNQFSSILKGPTDYIRHLLQFCPHTKPLAMILPTQNGNELTSYK